MPSTARSLTVFEDVVYNLEKLVVNLSRKAAEAMHEIAEAKEFRTKTETVTWALKYANDVRKLIGDDGVLVIEKNGEVQRIRIM